MTNKKYIAVYARNYIGIYTDDDALEKDLNHFDNPKMKYFNDKLEAALFIQDGLHYDLHYCCLLESDLNRIYKLTVNQKSFPSIVFASSFIRRAEREKFINERRERKKKGLNS